MPISPSHSYSKKETRHQVIVKSLRMKTEKATASTVVRKALHVNDHNNQVPQELLIMRNRPHSFKDLGPPWWSSS